MLAAATFEGLALSDSGRIVDVNEQLARLLGYAEHELVGREVAELVAPAARGRVTAHRSGGDEPYGHTALRKDGSTLEVEVRARDMVIGGRALRVTAVRDVTEQRQVEIALQAIVQGTPHVGARFFEALVSETARALGVRHVFVAALQPGLPERARTIAFCVDGEAVPNFEYELAGTPCADVQHGQACVYSADVRREFPDDAWVHANGIQGYLGLPLQDADGRPLGILAAFHDRPFANPALARSVLSVFAGRAAAELERLHADETLRHTQASLRATLETTPHVAIQWFDADGRVVYWNPASEQMFGYRADEAVGKTLDQLIHTPEESAAFLAVLRAIARAGMVVGPAEYPFRRRDGSAGTCLSTTFAIPGPQGAPCFACMDVDISDRKRAEAERALLQAQLHHAQKLDALGTLAGGIAHDFNNILGIIFVLGGIIAAERTAPERVRQDASELLVAAGRARDLVRQILAFSRKPSGEREVTELGAIVRETLTFLRSALPANIDLRIEIAADVPAVRAAAAQLHQVIMNLGTNALHALGELGGELVVTLEAVMVDDDHARALGGVRPGPHARLSVRDTGCGMDAETRARIFEPFFTTKPPGQGTGLGLAVVHGIAQAHEGALEVESEAGQGATFRLYLPAVEGGPRAPAVAAVAPARGRGERILLVDDEAALRSSWVRRLQALGYRVTAFGDPLEALEEVRRAPGEVDVLVTDLTMPNLSGLELVRRLHELRPGLPVLLVSGHGEGWTDEELRALGVSAFLPKPVEARAIAEALRRVLA